MQAMLTLILLCLAPLVSFAGSKAGTVQAVDLPPEIFTGDGLETTADFHRVIDSIKIGPKGAKFTKEQLSGMADILSAMIKVAESKKVDAIYFSSSSDLYTTLNATLSGRRGWEEVQRAAASDASAVPVSAVVALLKGRK